MKSIFMLVLTSLLFINVYSQKKMTAKEFAGLKGNVKSVVTEFTFLETDGKKSDQNERLPAFKDFYDKTGNIQNDPEKPDSDYTVKYRYDRQGRIIEESLIDATGLQWGMNKFKYNPKGLIWGRTYYLANTMVSDVLYTYDHTGNLAEQKYVPAKSNIDQKTVMMRFSDYKFDSYGNWIKRTVTRTTVLDGKTSEVKSMDYRTIEYYK